MVARNWKILLFEEQCATNTKDGKLKYAQLEFLLTSVQQLMDQGRVMPLQQRYHKRLMCKLLQRITATEERYEVSLMPLSMLAASWNAVSHETTVCES
jgi:hypothetical protein